MDHIFLSDVHLGAFSDQRNQAIEEELIALIRYCSENDIKIHLLGDLFDYWMEYPSYKPNIGGRLLAAFEEYNRNCSSVTYILGNHDNWTNGFFDEIGFRTEKNSAELDFNGKRVFIHHGDGLADPNLNLPRPLFHKILRSDWFTKIYQFMLPPEAGIDLMRKFSVFSRKSSGVESGKLNNWSENFLKNSEFDIVISGHDHIPRIETFSHGHYINPGAFFDHRTLGYYTNGTIRLVTWSKDEYHLKPLSNTFEIVITI